MTVNTRKAPLIIALALTVAGCEYIGPQLHKKMPLPAAKPIEEGQTLPLEDKTASSKAAKVEVFPNDEASISARKSATPAKKGTGKGEYSLNFDDADLGEVAKVILSEILKKNYTISPQVSGKVTLQTTEPLSKDELIPTLEMLLSVNNAALSVEDGMYMIKPANEAVYSASFQSLGTSRLPSGYQTRVIPVKNVAASEIAEILKPLLPEKALVHVDPNRNILLVSGSGAELSRVMEVVGTFDVDVLRGRSFALFTPAHVDASKIIEELEQVFQRVSDDDKTGQTSFFRFIEIERLNAILAITHNAKYLQDIESWVYRLDRTNAEASGGVNVYRAQHVSALDLANTLSQIFGSGVSSRSGATSIASGRKALSATNKSASGSSSSGTSSSSMQGSNKDSGMDKSLSDSRTQNRSVTSGLSSGLGGGMSSTDPEMQDVRIIPDEGNNALVIVAKSEQYAKIQRVIKQLDVLPLQVLIDATIVEVTLNDDLQYGIQWFISHNNGGTNIIKGGGASPIVTGSDSGLNLGDIAKGVFSGGFTYAFSSNSKDINAILRAEAANNNINVISSPSLMVLNNQEASIRVGDSIPTRSSESTNTNTIGSDSVVQTSAIQMVDTGINLQIKPRVNAGGLVLMDILQTVNDVKQTESSTIDSPTISKREIQSSVAVQSGETIVLGGLIKEDNIYNRYGVPLLHEIPLIGPLFGSTTRNKDKNELVVLITPRVVNSRQDARSITDEFRRKLSSIYEVPYDVNHENVH